MHISIRQKLHCSCYDIFSSVYSTINVGFSWTMSLHAQKTNLLNYMIFRCTAHCIKGWRKFSSLTELFSLRYVLTFWTFFSLNVLIKMVLIKNSVNYYSKICLTFARCAKLSKAQLNVALSSCRTQLINYVRHK